MANDTFKRIQTIVGDAEFALWAYEETGDVFYLGTLGRHVTKLVRLFEENPEHVRVWPWPNPLPELTPWRRRSAH